MKVYWDIDATSYVLQRVTPVQLEQIKQLDARKHGFGTTDVIGIPQYYAIHFNGDIDWYPYFLRGNPRVIHDPLSSVRNARNRPY